MIVDRLNNFMPDLLPTLVVVPLLSSPLHLDQMIDVL